MAKLADRFKKLREFFNETQTEAAKRFGVDLTAWQRWEWGTRTPSGPAIKLLEIYEKEIKEKVKK